jgi:hypothetical protein
VAAHHQLLADKQIQFALPGQVKIDPPQIPEWLKGLSRALRAFADFFGPIAPVLFWGLVAVIAGLILYYILREFTDFTFPWQRRKNDETVEDQWVPDAAPARALLAEADGLAAEGRFAEAAHLLLLRSVEDIERRKPDILRPSSTAREIAVAQTLPDKARGTFGLIARHVEASLFGGRSLDAGGWDQCREAYGRFALAGEWQ